MLRGSKPEQARYPVGEERGGRERRRTVPPATQRSSPTNLRAQPPQPPQPRTSPRRRCYVCGLDDHLSWTCPNRAYDRDVTMETADASETPRRSLYVTSCWAHQKTSRATLPVRVEGVDTHALLDSGSAITLVRADLVATVEGDSIPVTCVHGDVRQYPTTSLHVQTPKGETTVQAGVIPNLPVPLLIGTDCVLFERYWAAGASQGKRHRRSRRRRNGPLPACPVFPADSDEPCSESGSGSASEDERDVARGPQTNWGCEGPRPPTREKWGERRKQRPTTRGRCSPSSQSWRWRVPPLQGSSLEGP